MLNILGRRASFCDQISRRNMLQVGALAGAGLALPGLWSAQRANAAADRTPRAALLIFLGGGPSHFESFDPKPDAPTEIRGPFRPINTKVPGLQISETLPLLADLADKYSLVRSCCHDNSGHGGGQRYVQTGYKSASLEDEQPHDYPAVGSIISRCRGPMHEGMPTYIHVPNGHDGGAKYLGNAYDAFQVYSNGKPTGMDLNLNLKLNRVDDRRELRKALDRFAATPEIEKKAEAINALEQQALELLTSSKTKEAFNLERETTAVRERYGNHEFGKCMLLARRFIEAGAGIVSVRVGSWDHHGNAGGTVESGVKDNNVPLDQALSALIGDLHDRGLSEHVLLYCWGEFGRSPRINQFSGRDHWPQAMSVLMSGGGIQPGRVIGATNKKGESPIERPCSPADVLATVYQQLGIDPSQKFINNSGRPTSILAHGEPIRELL